ncbi:MAG: DUF1217 domain-containing protein [Pseudomonadota bacterium]
MFQPVIPSVGLTGWRFLQQTYDTQFETFSRSRVIQNDAEYFRESIASVTSAEALVSDRRLLTVALGAFGLQDDINNRFFLQKVLQDGILNQDALANRLADKRYRNFSEAFGFGPSEFLQTGRSDFPERIIGQFEANAFEIAAGEQDGAMRIALYAQRELEVLAVSEASTDTKWFTVMGDPPLRELFERALNLPNTIGQIDIDQQLDIFKDRARFVFGTDGFDQFRQDSARQDVITKFVIRDQASQLNAGFSSNAIALTLLQN